MTFADVIGRDLWQWDVGRKIMLRTSGTANISRVDFSSAAIENLISMPVKEHNGKVIAEIPNVMLQHASDIKLYVVSVESDTERTIFEKTCQVRKKKKPEGYVQEQQEILNYQILERRVADLEKNAGGIAEETDPTVPDWAKQPEKPTYTAQEVGAMPKDTKIPTKTSELENDSGFLTKHQDLSGYAKKATTLDGYGITDGAKKSDIPSIPITLPNPNKLTFAGAVSAEYDGSKSVVVTIPEGGETIEVDAELKEYMNMIKPKIKQAIINKGGNVEDSDSFGDYATRITEIPNGVYAAEDLPKQTTLTATYDSVDPKGITLMFSNVNADGYLIIKKKNAKPESSADGEIVYNGTYREVIDTDVELGNIYYYRIYPRNSKNQYQSIEEQSVATCDYKSRVEQIQAKNLALDDRVAFGYYNGQVFVWSVVDRQNVSGPIMAAEQNCGNKQWDAPENDSENPNPITVRKSSGNNRWAFSNVRQWLNSDAEKAEWFEKQHEYDVVPSGYKSEKGFLNEFTEAEIESIVTRTNACILDTNDGGGSETVEDLIWLPSSCEVGKEITAEGYKFEKYDGTNASTAYQSNWWLRTINNATGTPNTACNVRYVFSGGSLGSLNASYSYAVRPFCQLRGDAWLTWSEKVNAYVLADDSQRAWEV